VTRIGVERAMGEARRRCGAAEARPESHEQHSGTMGEMASHPRANHKTPPPRRAALNGPLGAVGVIVALSIIPGVMLYKSCTALRGETREAFSRQYSCPMASITIKDRQDVQAAQFEKPASPPADVAGDPARLAVWKANQPQPWSVEFFELTGCGRHVLWGCRLPSRSSSAGVHAFCPYTRDLP
jgi:hypothetical protein